MWIATFRPRYCCIRPAGAQPSTISERSNSTGHQALCDWSLIFEVAGELSQVVVNCGSRVICRGLWVENQQQSACLISYLRKHRQLPQRARGMWK